MCIRDRYIDAFNHILPKKYQAVLEQKVPNRDMSSNLSRYAETVPTLLDLDAQMCIRDRCRSLHMAVTSGIHAGRMAAHYCASLASAPEPDEAQIQRIHERVYAPLDPERSIGWKEFEMTLQRILTEGAGPCRTEKKLLRAKEKLEQVQAASGLVGAKDLHDLLRLHEVHNLLTIGPVSYTHLPRSAKRP